MAYYTNNPLPIGEPLSIIARKIVDNTAYGNYQRQTGSSRPGRPAGPPTLSQCPNINALTAGIIQEVLPYDHNGQTFIRSVEASESGITYTMQLGPLGHAYDGDETIRDRSIVEALLRFNDTNEVVSVNKVSATELKIQLHQSLPIRKAFYLMNREELLDHVFYNYHSDVAKQATGLKEEIARRQAVITDLSALLTPPGGINAAIGRSAEAEARFLSELVSKAQTILLRYSPGSISDEDGAVPQ